MSKRIILNYGDRFGDLEVICESIDNYKTYKKKFWCKCVCNNEVLVTYSNLTSGNTKTCGCSKRKHNMSYSRIYNIWHGMIQRCANKNVHNYHRYGGRGINVCERWLDFKNFYIDMHETYKDNLTLDRIDNSGNYTSENCRWITNIENQANKDGVIKVLYNNKIVTLRDYAISEHIVYSTALYRYNKGKLINAK